MSEMSVYAQTLWCNDKPIMTVYTVPGRPRQMWCNECRLGTGFVIDLWLMTDQAIADEPIATVEGCTQCNQDGDEG